MGTLFKALALLPPSVTDVAGICAMKRLEAQNSERAGHRAWLFRPRGRRFAPASMPSLNCGPGSKDDPAAVAENRRRVAARAGAAAPQLVTLSQIHSPIVHIVRPGLGRQAARKATPW